MKRLNVTDETKEIVTMWAFELHKKYDIRASNGVPIYKNFPQALEMFVKTCNSHKINAVFK